MPEAKHLELCIYCGQAIPEESIGADSPWLMEKASYGLNAVRWSPKSRAVWDLDKFYKFCSFACVAQMILDFVKNEKWRVAESKVKARQGAHS